MKTNEFPSCVLCFQAEIKDGKFICPKKAVPLQTLSVWDMLNYEMCYSAEIMDFEEIKRLFSHVKAGVSPKFLRWCEKRGLTNDYRWIIFFRDLEPRRLDTLNFKMVLGCGKIDYGSLFAAMDEFDLSHVEGLEQRLQENVFKRIYIDGEGPYSMLGYNKSVIHTPTGRKKLFFLFLPHKNVLLHRATEIKLQRNGEIIKESECEYPDDMPNPDRKSHWIKIERRPRRMRQLKRKRYKIKK